MTKAIEVVYEDNVLKPLEPIEGLKEHERMVAILSPRPVKKGLREIAGTLTHDEAEAMQKLIDEDIESLFKHQTNYE
ncbi:antitoxin family protein [Candidatus Methanoperedens nitratireducens]|nr:antitoxin family protein [Candidatus Methanoperedens nitroreducens]